MVTTTYSLTLDYGKIPLAETRLAKTGRRPSLLLKNFEATELKRAKVNVSALHKHKLACVNALLQISASELAMTCVARWSPVTFTL